MNANTLRQFFFLLLAIVFSIALMFAFVQFPVWLESLLLRNVGFPGFDQGASETNAYLSNLYIDSLSLRIIGYGSLLLIVAFIVTGFVTRKSGWAWAGAFALFLPVFGQFALSMFFLSGLGILRAGWLPFLDISWWVLDLGNAVYLPYELLMKFFGLFNWYAHDFIAWSFMAVGSVLFVWGVMEWFRTRFGDTGVAIRSIYRISRHPQYLGWILWSYGLMLYPMYLNNMKKSWGMSSGLPWLLMTAIVVAICLLEELKMKQHHGETYENYRNKTPFLLPLPVWLKILFRYPARMVIRKKSPDSTRDILKITVVYTLVLMIVSTLWIDFRNEVPAEKPGQSVHYLAVDSILAEIDRPGQSRRAYFSHIDYLEKQGRAADSLLIRLLGHPAPEVREFSAYALGRHQAGVAVNPLVELLKENNSRVVSAAIASLGDLKAPEAVEPLLEMLDNPGMEGYRFRLYGALTNIGSEKVVPFLVEGIKKPPWYQQNAAMRALYDLDPDAALPYLFPMLQDEEPRIRREVVFILVQDPPPASLGPLQQVIDDEDFETRFYARQAIRKIRTSAGR